jgi:septal ring factor EnvC (AmiA/AmiB activator)
LWFLQDAWAVVTALLLNRAYSSGGAAAANALQAKDKARKDLEKARKVREPLTKKLAEDPNALAALEAEVAELTAQIAAMQ